MRPNILLITSDQQRWDALGYNGNEVLQTPNLDALAAQGVNFRRAYSTCPVCIPARRTLISGLHPATHGMTSYQDGVEFDPPCTLPGRLRDAGYQTQLIGKMHLHPQRKRFGFDNIILSETSNYRPTSKFQAHNDYAVWLQRQGVACHPNSHGVSGNGRVARPHHLPEELHQTSWVAEQAVDFLTRTRDPAAPWFLHLSFFVPHPPLTPPEVYFNRYYAERHRFAPVIGDWVPDCEPRKGLRPDAAIGPFRRDEIAAATAGYYGLINHLDDRIGYVLERYREYGNDRANEPLLILFSSDHGEMLGDHHMFRKSLPYESSAHVPFFISGYNLDFLRAGESDALVCWEDIMPTLLEAAGAEVPLGLDGHSLATIAGGAHSARVRDWLLGECRANGTAHQFVVHGDHKYIWFERTGEEQCFNLATDPGETRDLSAELDLRSFRVALAEHLSCRTDVRYDPASCRPCGNRPPTVWWPADRDSWPGRN